MADPNTAHAQSRSVAAGGFICFALVASGLILRGLVVHGSLAPVDPGDLGWMTGIVICFAVQLWCLGPKAKKLLECTGAPLVASAIVAVVFVIWSPVQTVRAHALWVIAICLGAATLSLRHGHPAPRILIALFLLGLGIDMLVMEELPLGDMLVLLGANGIATLVFQHVRRTKIAFGVIPAFRKYELRLMRYVAVADVVKGVVARQGAARVLDAGCGRGRLKLFCPTEAEMHGLDFDPDSVERSRGLGYQVQQHNLEKENLPFADNTFDVVVFCHCLEHVHKFDKVVCEGARILKPGGFLDIGVPTKVRWLQNFVKSYFSSRNRGHGDTVNFFTAESLVERLKSELPEFTLEELRGFRFLSARKNLPLEDWRWFWRLSTWWGRKFPHLCPEVNVVLRKPLLREGVGQANQRAGGIPA